MIRLWRTDKSLIAVVVLSILVRVVLVGRVVPGQWWDSASYIDYATHLVSTGWLPAVGMRTFGYPLFLIISGGGVVNLAATVIFQQLLGVVMRRLVKPLRSVLSEAVQSKYFIPICFIAAFIVRVCWIYSVDAQPVSDFRWYYERGIDFSAGRGYSINGVPTAFWPVGYPAFLGLVFSLFGTSLFIAKISNTILYMGILLFSYYIAKQLFYSEFTGRVTLLILSFYPNHIAYSSLLASEILFLFLLLGGFMLLMVPKHQLLLAIASGLVFGLACLVKPVAVFIPAIFFAIHLIANISRKRRKTLLRYLILFATVYLSLCTTILPWIIRNYNVFNGFVFIANEGGITLLIGNNPYATGTYILDDRVTSLLGDTTLDEHARDVKARDIAVKYIVEHPLETIQLWPKKFWHLYVSDDEGIYWNESGIIPLEGNLRRGLDLFMIFAQRYYVLIRTMFLLSVLVFLHKRRKTRTQLFPTLGIWIVLYFTIIYLLFFGITRFHFPVIPWIVMYVGALAEVLLEPLSKNDNFAYR